MASANVTTGKLVWTKGRGRGFRPGGPFSPSRRPGGTGDNNMMATNTKAADGPDGKMVQTNQAPGGKSGSRRLMAKYTYNANPESPLGEKELNLKQGQHMHFIEKHRVNEQWWKVENEEGQMGFVPAKYLITVEEKPTELPWIANKRLEDAKIYSPDAKPVFKAYVSAYNKAEKGATTKDVRAYYCDLCRKQLNGPQPYSAHMSSKAHKEEVKLAEEYAAEGIERD